MNRVVIGNLFSLSVLVSLAAIHTSAQAELILHYTFDEPVGTTVLDTSTSLSLPANGELMGGATRTSNTPGLGSLFALDLLNDDPNAHVLGPDAEKLDNLNQLTISTWVNVNAFPGTAGTGVTNSGNKRLVAKQDPAGGGFTFNMNSSVNDGTAGANDFKVGLFLGGAGGAGFTFATSSADIDENTISAQDHWVFLAVTYDGTLATDNTNFYIGDADTSVTQLGVTRTLAQVTTDSGTGRLGVGFTDAASGFDFSVNGFQDDVRIYDNALSLAELDAVRFSVAIPEPSSVLLLAVGALLAMVGSRFRNR